MREALILVGLILLGSLFARDSLRLHRWSPELFRGGLVVFRESWPLARLPERLPTPEIRTGLFYETKYRVLGPDEIAFTAQTFNAPLLLGRLELDRPASTLTASGRLHWGLWALFLVGFPLMGFPWGAIVSILVLGATNYTTEIRAFRRVVQRIASEAVSQDVIGQPHNKQLQRTGDAIDGARR